MPDIPLRTYEKKIEDLIGQNLLQEAVVHCKHILNVFPKNISTYRILGQVFLEGKHYSEAADIFNRVLTVFPDDFISNVGMSIVRENENNLDAAIWHMELAFDNQPSNITIQEELKRLFGRRDGTHPAKIRLTRGALVRMYARGELYQQAIAEIKSALNEDIKRLDLEVFLARMYYLSGEQSEAIELCNKLVKELPYCYEINKILAETNPTGQTDKSNIYKARLIELDPYENYINPKYPTLESIPEDKVMIEELSESEASELIKDSAWITGLDNEWNKTSSTNFDGSSSKPPFENTAEESLRQSPVDLPFGLSQPTANEPTPSQQPEIEGTKPEDWLRSTDASSFDKGSEENPPENSSASEQIPDWLNSLVPEENESPREPDNEPEKNENSGQPFAFNPESSEEMAFPGKVEQPEETSAFHQGDDQPTSNSDLPDWLKNFDVEESAEPVSKDDLPDWLNSLQPQTPAPAEKSTPVFEEEVKKPTNASAFSTEEPQTSETSPVSPLEGIEDVSETDIDRIISPEQSEIPEAAEKNENLPDWIRALQTPESSEPTTEPSPDTEPEQGMETTEPTGPAEEPSSNTAGSEGLVSPAAGDELLEWLRDLKPEDNQSASSETESPEDAHLSTDNLSYDFEAELQKLSQLDQTENKESSAPIDNGVQEIFESQVQENSEADQIPANSVEQTDVSSVPSEETNIPDQEMDQTIPQSETSTTEEAENAAIPEPVYIENDINSLAKMIRSDMDIAPILQRLETLSKEKPEDYLTWQVLGDAYAKSNQYSNALAAYNRAERILISQK